MDIGIGLPNAIHDVDSDPLLEFARRADARGFSSLGTVDRVVYPNFEPLLSLAAAAAVTERIRLATKRCGRAMRSGRGRCGRAVPRSWWAAART
jgi:Luciferase-like monooxygenase